MRVKDLIEKLKEVDQNAYVVINSVVVSGVETLKGRIHDGWYNKEFVRLEKGKEKGVTLTHMTEYSDGVIRPCEWWS